MSLYFDPNKKEKFGESQPLSQPKMVTPPITGGQTAPSPQSLRQPGLTSDRGPGVTPPAGLPQAANMLQEVRSGDASTYSPEAMADAQKIPVIRGTADSGIIPDKINNLSDLANAIQGMGLNRAPSWQVSQMNPETAKINAMNRMEQLKALSTFANAQIAGQSSVEAARVAAEAKGKPTQQETLLGKMMEQQELGKAQEQALGQFQQGLVSGGAATLDPKTGKAAFADPRYQKVFDEYTGALKGVTDRNAIPDIANQYQKRIADTTDWVKLSDKKVLKSLPDDFARHGQDLIQQMRGGKQGPNQLTAEEVDILRTKALNGDPSVLALLKEVQNRKAKDRVNTERQARVQDIRVEQATSNVPAWQPFTRIGE